MERMDIMLGENEGNMSVKKDLYDVDFYSWCLNQADLVKKKDFDHLDLENIAEEIESLGNRERRELRSRLDILIMHMLKMKFQPELSCKSWLNTIKDQRRNIKEHLLKNPGLKSSLDKICIESYEEAKWKAHLETNLILEDFPPDNPFSLQEILEY